MTMQQTGVFDASGSAPPSQDGMPKHAPGKFPFLISKTDIVPNKNTAEDPDGFQFCVTFDTPQGSIIRRHNLWNKNAQTVKIGTDELTALCHATGIFRLDMQNNKGAELVGGRGMIEVVEDGKYSRVAKVFDVNGNIPGQAPQQQQHAPNNNTSFAPAPQPQGGGAWPAPQNGGQQPSSFQPQATTPAPQPQQEGPKQPSWGAPRS